MIVDDFLLYKRGDDGLLYMWAPNLITHKNEWIYMREMQYGNVRYVDEEEAFLYIMANP